MKPHSRKLQQDEDARGTTVSPLVTHSPDPPQHPVNSSSSTPPKRSFKPNSPFDSSVAITAVVLLSALFFMGFFSIYIRHFADDRTAEVSRRRRRRTHGPPPSYPSSWVPPWRPSSSRCLDPSTVLSLPSIPYGGDVKHHMDCAICLSEFKERETVKLIPYCGHVFHPECIETWLSSHVSCPVCRSTRMYAVEEVRLGVVQTGDDHGLSENQGSSTVECCDTCIEEGGELRPDGSSGNQGSSTVESCDTCTEEGGEVGPLEMRRTCSCSSLGDPMVLQRSLSF